MEMEVLAGQNPWWKNQGWEGDDRHLSLLGESRFRYERAGYVPEKKGVIVVYGPRQVGKTTWIKTEIAKKTRAAGKTTDIAYLNAEVLRDRFELYDAMKTLGSLYNPTHIYIDEINSVNDWERTIKTLVDENAFKEKQVVLTGSSSINIMKKAEQLPGRMAGGQYKFRFYPLSFAEVVKVYGVNAGNPEEAMARLDELNTILYRYFLHGGFIKAVNSYGQNGSLEEDLFAVYSAWIDGELAKAKKSPETATHIMAGMAESLTNEVSWTALSKTASHPTIADYVETLKDMFVATYIEKSRKARAGAPKNKKIYFTDPFLYWVAQFRARKISRIKIAETDSATMGKLAELAALKEMGQCLDQSHHENDFDARRYVHYEKEKNGETDFVVKLGKRTHRLESKFGAIGKEKENVTYLTKSTLAKNKLPLAVFLLHPEESLKLTEKIK
ncbi:MAG: ATP-binding protein [Candidatus Diapherotrites archaeon]|nr:ATP-binding protein [Candidatus Diapherotrites archaeon]